MQKLWLIFTLALIAPFAHAQGLVVAPTRIILEPNQRTTEASISNFTDRTVRYRLTLEDLVMNENGTTEAISGTFPYSVKPMVRFMPKTLTLAPRQRQTVRILATRPAGMAAGDYHSHLVLNEIFAPSQASPNTPSPTANTSMATSTGGTNATSFSLDIGVTFSTGVPLIVQVGKVSSSLTLQNASLVRDAAGVPESVALEVQRSGNAEGFAMAHGVLADGTPAFPARMVRIYRERDTARVLQAIDADKRTLAAQGITVQWLNGKDLRTVQQTMLAQ